MNEGFVQFMNKGLAKHQADVLLALKRNAYVNQRTLAAHAKLSLGNVNETLRVLEREGYLSKDRMLTERANDALKTNRPKQAVILAAGSGIRMSPLNDLPKGLLEVRGERLIDRLIAQLRAVGIGRITIITGFMKERYEYLSEQASIELIYNPHYARRNNLHSLLLAADRLENAYVLPSDLWFHENPFSCDELYPWYMLSSERTAESDATCNRKQQMVPLDGEGYRMVGVAYLCGSASERVAQLLRQRAHSLSHQQDFWESVLLYAPCQHVFGRMVDSSAVKEIDTFEDIRNLECSADQISSAALDVIRETLHTTTDAIADVEIMKKGMTNRSFLFTVGTQRYIMRLPGEGSNIMIDRRREHDTYCTIAQHGLGDRIIYFSPDTGYKITTFWGNARVCNPHAPNDVAACMRTLRTFHDMRLKVQHTFDLFERIDYYESLLEGQPSVFEDYAKTKATVLSLRPYIDAQRKPFCLTHIDAVPDNFLFVDGEVRLIDWEYAAMQDPHVDIAMFAVYSMYDRAHIEALIDSYFTQGCDAQTRVKIDCYIAVCGLLWSNWCEYKRKLGVEFGEYALWQYRFARHYGVIAAKAIETMEDVPCTL